MPAIEKEKRQKRKPGRTPTSCAECRRQKLKCDKTVPCEKCVSRGLASICPDRCLAPGKGNRMVLADTVELHERIEILCNRIRDLEEALLAHGQHPLLEQKLLDIKGPSILAEKPGLDPRMVAVDDPRVEVPAIAEPTVLDEEAAVVDAFGTLTIGSLGENNFLGQTARSEYLIRAPEGHKNAFDEADALSRSLLEVMTSCDSFMLSSAGALAFGNQLYEKLPTLGETLDLCDIYFQHGEYMYVPLDRNTLISRMIHPLYGHLQSLYSSDIRCFQNLSFLFIVLAFGAFFDPGRPPNSPTAHEYYMLSRSALMLVNPIKDSTLILTRTMIHIAQFLELADWNSMASGTSWVYSGIAIKLGYSLGLHLNGARWNMSAEDTRNRTALFSQLFVLDTWQSFGFGRPPSIAPEFADAGVPVDAQEYVEENGEKSIGYHHWMWQYTAVLHKAMSSAFGVKPPSYKLIIDLDRRIRDFPVPLYLRPRCMGTPTADPVNMLETRHMQRWGVLSSKEWTLLNLHRPYFAQALQEQPQALLKHRYAASVLAAYRSAWRLIEGFKNMVWSQTKEIICRVNLAWSQILSAAIVMCMLVTRAPESTLTKSSLDTLDLVANIFEVTATKSPAAAKSLKSVKCLAEKAHETIHRLQSASQDTTEETTSMARAELDRLSGKTHLIQKIPLYLPDGTPNPEAASPPTNSSNSDSVPSPSSSFTDSTSASSFPENVHSRIAEDMAVFYSTDGSVLKSAPELMFDEPSDTFPMDIEFDFNGQATVPASPPSQDDIDRFLNELSSRGTSWPNGVQVPDLSGTENHNPQQLATGAPVGFEQNQSEGLTLDPGWQYFVEQLGF